MLEMETRDRGYTSLLPPPPTPPPPPQLSPPSSSSFQSQYTSLDNKISPSILIIAILAVIFFLSGLLHLLIRCLIRPTIRDPDDTDTATAFQGQLQQLFHLHDSGVDQSFIDSLPVFLYKSIVGGNKDPFDCAVCLLEFEPDDKLRLLPKCSHAFHIECIDTWLLSHSTCPICRGSLLLPEFSPSCSPMVLILESASDSSREIVPDNFVNSNVSFSQEDEILEKSGEILQKNEVLAPPPSLATPEMKVVPVKLGKFRNLNPERVESTSNSSNIDERRCFSMGSFEYVMDEKSMLQVAIKPPEKKAGTAKTNRRRLAMSECDYNSQREGFRGFERSSIFSNPSDKRDNFSFSKTWLRGKKEKPTPVIAGDGSRRTFSLNPEAKDGAINNNISKQLESSRIGSEFGSESEFDMDVEVGSYNDGGNGRVMSRGEEMPSFARRTLLWVIGRNQNHKVVNHI